MNPTMKTKITLSVLVLSIVGFAVWYVNRQQTERDAFKIEAAKQEGVAVAYKRQYEDIIPQIAAISESNSRLESTIRDLKTKVSAIPIPPPPGPAPNEPIIKADLESAGLAFSWLQNVTDSNTLTVTSGKLIWGWHQEAVAAPQLRLAVSGYRSIAEEQSKLLDGKDAQIGLLNEGTRTLGLAYDAQSKRGDALRDAVKACESARRASTVKWYFKVGAAAAVGYLAGRALK